MNDKTPLTVAAAQAGGRDGATRTNSGRRSSVPHSTRRDLGACRATRVRIMLHLGRTFSRAQVADLMARAARWGADEAYDRGLADGVAQEAERQAELRVAAMTQPEIPWSAEAVAQAAQVLKRRAEAAEVTEKLRAVPVLACYHGGPVPEWDFGPERAARAEHTSARLAALPEIRMAPTKEWP